MDAFKGILILSFVMLYGSQNGVVSADEDGKCVCGIFKPVVATTTKDEPVGIRPHNLNAECDHDSSATCMNMCKGFAGERLSREAACDFIKNTEIPFMPMVFSRACDDDIWSYTGFVADFSVCCADGKVTNCLD